MSKGKPLAFDWSVFMKSSREIVRGPSNDRMSSVSLIEMMADLGMLESPYKEPADNEAAPTFH